MLCFRRAGEGQTPFRISEFYRIVSILTKNSMLSTKKTSRNDQLPPYPGQDRPLKTKLPPFTEQR